MSERVDIELPIGNEPPDETDISLRAYFSRMEDARLREYSSDWSDEQVIAWDALMLVCCERDVEIDEYRRVLEEHIQRRGI